MFKFLLNAFITGLFIINQPLVLADQIKFSCPTLQNATFKFATLNSYPQFTLVCAYCDANKHATLSGYQATSLTPVFPNFWTSVYPGLKCDNSLDGCSVVANQTPVIVQIPTPPLPIC